MTPIRRGTAARLGLRPPRLVPARWLVFPDRLTDEEHAELKRLWFEAFDNAPQPPVLEFEVTPNR